MSAWKEPNKKYTIAVNGKKTKPAVFTGMDHKNSDLKGCGYHNTWSGNAKNVYKIKTKEGVYEFDIGVSYSTGQKIKAGGNSRVKKPIPPSCKIDSAWEFAEIRIFVNKLKMPTLHTCEVDVYCRGFKNKGTPKDFDPWAMFNLDLRTGHMVMGKWTTHPKVCDLFAGSQKVKFN